MEGKKKLNILIFSWRGPGHPNSGGAEISSHEHAKAWVKAGHTVMLFTSYYKGAKKEEEVDGVDIKRAGYQIFGVHWAAFKWYLLGNHQKFDLVIDEFHGIPFFTPLYVRAKKLGFIHEVAREVWSINLSSLPAALGKTFEPLIFKLYKNIPFMTVSRSTKKDLILWGIDEKNITVINNGVTISKVSAVKKEQKKTIVFLGALAKDKGIETALDVFSYLKKVKNDWQFWVVGKADPNYLKYLKTQSEKLKLGNNIKFWGYVSEQKKFELLARAHLLINPSIREGWGLVIIEAASMGIPAVAFNVAGLRDSIRDNKTGVLTEKNTVEELATEAVKLLDDPLRYQQLKKNATAWSKKFTWEKSTVISLDLIKKITG